MRVFLAGAAGAIGRPLVPLLVAVGHQVTGTTRSPERARAIEAAGATAVVVDALEPDALRAAAEQAEPDVVIHQLTSLPERFNPGKRGVYEATNRLRSEGTRNLLGAARAAGARRFVCQSVSFAYAPGAQAEVKDEDAPLALDTPGQLGEGARVLDAMERAVLGTDGLAGVVLRYGWFYGPGTYCGENGSIAADVRKRRFPIVGRGTGLWSFVHVDDAAAATVIAVERGDPGAYNVVDDEPAAVREWLPAYADAMGAPPPRRIPIWMARLFAGKAAALVDVLPAASNAKARRELGWEPRWRSWRDGFRDAPR